MDSVALEDFEMRLWGYVGKARHHNAEHRNHGLGPSATDRNVEYDITGAQCEYAASLLLNRYCRPHVGHIDKPDVGGCIEVRSTLRRGGRLIVKPNAKEFPYVLIEKDGNRFYFRGWMWASEAKRYPLLTQFGDPAHFVPQEDLHDLASLRKVLTDG